MSRFENLEFGDAENEQPTSVPAIKNEEYYAAEAQAAFEMGKFEKALRFYSKILEFNPRNAAAWCGQVRMLIELGEYAEARVWVEKALALFPEDAEILATKGVALARLGDLTGAISYSDAAVETRGNTPYIWLARADVLMARKEKRAEFCLQKAVDLGARNWLVLWLAARVSLFYDHFARSLKLLTDAMALDPSRPVLWSLAGECQLALGLDAQALRSFEQATELDPERDLRLLTSKIANRGWLAKLAGRWRQFRQKT
jgi:tetratricopeptide (TPR) repeat protein